MGIIRRCVVVLAIVFGVCACDQQAMIDKLTPHPAAEIGRSVIDEWRTGKIDELRPMLSRELDNPDSLAKLRDISTRMPSGTPTSVKLVGTNTFERWESGKAKQATYNLSYEYQFEHVWLVVNVVLVNSGDRTEIVGLREGTHDESLEQLNAFSLAGKGPLQWLFLLGVIAMPLFCLFALVTCVRTPMRRRKVWWALFTLVGVVTVTMNWTTGDVSVRLIWFQLFSASGTAQPYGPWQLALSFPLGAVWFLVRRRNLIAVSPPPLPDENVVSGAG
ncbi:hypothetical protein [Pinirhizobacter soli]|uniref:hypothetical protein n=1 Tax=Pinirhizobacter soli TaxID=2786953 RepID=UPI002029E6E9|nr:hypothetical protein [Pinirhizobacter soli]